VTKDKFLRMIVPSVPPLARTPVATVLDIADYFLKKGHPEWSMLPPASLRMRIGVGAYELSTLKDMLSVNGLSIVEIYHKNYPLSFHTLL